MHYFNSMNRVLIHVLFILLTCAAIYMNVGLQSEGTGLFFIGFMIVCAVLTCKIYDKYISYGRSIDEDQ